MSMMLVMLKGNNVDMEVLRFRDQCMISADKWPPWWKRTTPQRGASEDNVPWRWRHDSAVPWRKRAMCSWSEGGSHYCLSWWMWLVDAMCLLDGGGLCHLSYVILYEDIYSTVTRGTEGVRGTCRDKICLQIPAY